ncbi:hypothetical protein ACF0H5_011765 [Mactra antiquata]
MFRNRVNDGELENTPAPSETDDRYSKEMLNRSEHCNGKFVGYQQKFAILTDVIVDPKHGFGRRGGENISNVLMQKEEDEYYKLRRGYFNLVCPETFRYEFHSKTHVKNWFKALMFNKSRKELTIINKTISKWTIAVQRYDYANFYHAMTDWYNAFLIAKLFKVDPRSINILWIDGHPRGSLDSTWEVLFGDVIQSGSVRKPVLFEHLVWGMMGNDSPLHNHNSDEIGYIDEFRRFFLSRHGHAADIQNAILNCRNLKILFIWRRNYVAHPRNPSGFVSRKIQNEDELLSTARTVLPGHNISWIQIEKLTMKNQLKIIANTDILIGMHGAGLTHTLFLPKHAGLIEFYPEYWSTANAHFKAMARWRNIGYVQWKNTDRSREMAGRRTNIDIDIFRQILIEMKHKLCP